MPPSDQSPVRSRAAVLAFAAAFSVGCEIPSDLPSVETRWIVPAEETRFGVAELLPGSVTLSADMSAFVVDFDPESFSRTLADLCAACAAANGTTVPKPPFVASFASTIAFPSEVSAITVRDGEVLIELTNGLNFDPIRPGPGSTGNITLTVTDDADGDVLTTLNIDGATTPFAPAATLIQSLTLNPTVVNGSLEVEVVLDSPLGDPVTIDASGFISVTATPQLVQVTDVTIDVANRAVNLDPVTLDLSDVDQDLEDRVISGAFTVDVTNPFGLSADFQISIDGPTISTIQKSTAVTTAPQSSVNIAFTTGEIQSILGAPDLVLSGGAVVDPGVSPVTVLPGQELVLSAKLDLTLRIGGGN